jgi:hypothetical protein
MLKKNRGNQVLNKPLWVFVCPRQWLGHHYSRKSLKVSLKSILIQSRKKSPRVRAPKTREPTLERQIIINILLPLQPGSFYSLWILTIWQRKFRGPFETTTGANLDPRCLPHSIVISVRRQKHHKDADPI